MLSATSSYHAPQSASVNRAEVERARKLIAETCTGCVITEVDTVEDKIVYDGTDHLEFAKELLGRTVTGCERKGKQFWITLGGEGRYPVMHFGMTGMIQLRGGEPTWYRRKYNLGETVDAWPPKLTPADGDVRELAFIDPRRLGRLRLVPDPVLSHPPLRELGFDPVLNHPTLEEFQVLIGTKKGTVKGLIMDQAFSAGVGNWIADEVLYQARIHPMCPVPALTEVEVTELHRLLREVPLRAVEVNADSSLFPGDWLFRWRWGKGKKKSKSKKKAGEQSTLDAFVRENESQENGLGQDIKPKALEFLALVRDCIYEYTKLKLSRMARAPPSPSLLSVGVHPRSSPSFRRCLKGS
ncbi:hypothetical protein CC85DRAFT_285319 [Cutaneotrichosporon oleaginosum]|uniref:Formamidopyrimidine-DNA glycosylase catalytic domain-containing protein n=1 Tax=Cutaneotrichosporon oleaginosum TaxID=879819 RepID=A0A0J0XN81_9TREE|nr:uncharacterized protein CC85DRAFT_285319 [Cutaneotrichosporon oleaginosum]KLT42586.1 hypothetical protein CC85DRAFT_285319 [Cutaneotrichosporon oleaginosum]TXT05297.1 hypothetical protein COLE_06617 [Cutaneotrichosporon oleaginosum]